MDRTAIRLSHAVRRARTRYAPDDRVGVFEVAVDDSGAQGPPTVRGVVTDEPLRTNLLEALDAVDAAFDTAIRTLSATATDRTVSSAIAPVRGDPAADAEQVTQVLRGELVRDFGPRGAATADDGADWHRVRVPDGYVGWVRAHHLDTIEGPDPNHVVARRIEVDAETLHTGTPVDADAPASEGAIDPAADRTEVRLRTGETFEIPADAVADPGPSLPSGENVVTVAEQFAGTEYEWGGMTTEGIDCSGLAWVSYRVCGVTLPRDADQQRAMGPEVAREDLHPGDLLFFPGHVAISLGGDRYVHAYGGESAVVENTLDPADDDYLESLAEKFELAVRVVPLEAQP